VFVTITKTIRGQNALSVAPIIYVLDIEYMRGVKKIVAIGGAWPLLPRVADDDAASSWERTNDKALCMQVLLHCQMTALHILYEK
jgi:hypothetical protein